VKAIRLPSGDHRTPAGRLQVRQLRHLAGIHVHDVQLVGAVTIGEERDALRVRRPRRRAVAPASARQLAHP
jgi:hypothetical protein